MKITQKVFVIIAVLFGLLTIFAGTRVLLGSNPGYITFRPLLIYNTSMGLVYIVAGIIAWRNIKQGTLVSATIFILNILVLTVTLFLYLKGDLIAVESLRAMSLRTVVWFVLFAVFWWIYRSNTFKNP